MSSSRTLLVRRASNTLPGVGALRRRNMGEEAAKDLTDTLQARDTDRCLENRRHRAKDNAIEISKIIICTIRIREGSANHAHTRAVQSVTTITMVVCTNHPPWINVHTQFSVQRLQLSIKAELENVASLEPAAKDFEFFFRVWNLFFCFIPFLNLPVVIGKM